MKRELINIYRKVQYAFCGRKRIGVLSPGVQVTIEPFRIEENHGDIVHPCVRFIPEGYEGHSWWMVYTPYYKADASMENPILCFANGDDANNPPKEWEVFGLVNEKPEDGYNSDPTLLYDNGQLYVYWRENYEWSKNYHKYIRVTYVSRVSRDGIIKIDSPILYTEDAEIDTETCPTFMHNDDGTITAYAMHLKFHSNTIKAMRPWLKNVFNKIVSFTDLMGVYSQQKHYGIAVWQQNGQLTEPFVYEKTLPIKKCNALYRPWHMDLFDYQGKRYAIIQTNMMNADLCLAVRDKSGAFVMYKKPLITSISIGKLGIYKPCAGVTPDGLFYLYYTAQDQDNRALNNLYLTTCNFTELIASIGE